MGKLESDIILSALLLKPLSISQAVTNFWEHGAAIEAQQGENLVADLGQYVKLDPNFKTFLWSGLPNVAKASGGKYNHVQHFDGKVNPRDVCER